MSLRRFLNVAYALIIDEYQRMGIDLLSALEKVSEWGEGPTREPGAPSLAQAAHNQAAMTELSGMLSGVQGAPRRARRS